MSPRRQPKYASRCDGIKDARRVKQKHNLYLSVQAYPRRTTLPKVESSFLIEHRGKSIRSALEQLLLYHFYRTPHLSSIDCGLSPSEEDVYDDIALVTIFIHVHVSFSSITDRVGQVRKWGVFFYTCPFQRWVNGYPIIDRVEKNMYDRMHDFETYVGIRKH